MPEPLTFQSHERLLSRRERLVAGAQQLSTGLPIRKLAPLTVLFFVFYHPHFHVALFKYVFRSTKVDFVVPTLTDVLLKQAVTKEMNK